MAIAQIGSTTTDSDNTGTTDTSTTSYIQAAGADRVLIAIITTEGNVTHDTVTFDGNSLTKEVDLSNAERRVSIWYLVAPPVTTANVVVNLGGNADWGVILHSWSDVNQSTPIGASASNDGVSTDIDVTVTSEIGELAIDGFSHDDDDVNPVAGVGQTELADLQVVGDYRAGSSRKDGASPTVNLSWTSDPQDWVSCAISLIQASVVPGEPRTHQMML